MNKVFITGNSFGNGKNINNKSNNGIFCSHCCSYSYINIFHKNDEIFIKSKCENGHIDIKLLRNFLNNYSSNYAKDCQICYSHININQLYYCYSCSSKNIICSECRNKYHPKRNKKIERNHITFYFTLRCNYCPLHNRINTYYCMFCKEYLCIFDKKDHYFHNVLNLNLIYINFKNKTKLLIEKEDKENKEQIEKINNMINKIRNKLKEILNYKINVLYLKRNIISSYKLNDWNYNNIKNFKLIRKQFYNKKSVNIILSKINNSTRKRDNYFKSNDKESDIKRNKSHNQKRKSLK